MKKLAVILTCLNVFSAGIYLITTNSNLISSKNWMLNIEQQENLVQTIGYHHDREFRGDFSQEEYQTTEIIILKWTDYAKTFNEFINKYPTIKYLSTFEASNGTLLDQAGGFKFNTNTITEIKTIQKTVTVNEGFYDKNNYISNNTTVHLLAWYDENNIYFAFKVSEQAQNWPFVIRVHCYLSKVIFFPI